MNKEDRDNKRRQKAINRVEKAAQAFETEFYKSVKVMGYTPDLDDLEKLARYFEGLVKCMKTLNDKADKVRKDFYNEDEEGYRDFK
jgi:hypothetical protein